ncbi:Complement Clr-like EGF-like [Dermatophagoides pteronyssinus]|uniref:Complement Clr-like EGF-like n=1 Tax=Dermatophagoides pteronyssinus TaxID=6956 RepID=A0ABQ8IQF1_DERPT|nr:Complement Clr-like EGF-like [Dermatophagoides pteronyssinus]
MISTRSVILFFLFVISSLDQSFNVEIVPNYNHHQFNNKKPLQFTRVKRCRPGGIDCRMYRLIAPIQRSNKPLQSESIIHETYVSPPITYVSSSSSPSNHRSQYSSYSSSSSSASSSSSSSSSSSRIISHSPIPPSPSKIIERRVEKYHPPPPSQRIVQQKIIQEPIVQQKIVQEPIVQQKIVQEPIVQQKFETYVQKTVQQPIVQQKIVQEPIVQQKFEQQITQIKQPIVQQKFERIVQKPVVQQKFERIIEEHHYLKTPPPPIVHVEEIHQIIQKPTVSLRITACPEGHYLSSDGTHCKHIDCESGFIFSDSLLKCIDIDECTVETACLRDEQCINTYGSYVCRKICTQAGHRLNELHNTCEDINECLEGLHSCGQQQQCINTPGSYRCECPNGFRIDGQQCIDINECLESHDHLCPHDVSTCENTPGSYYCKCKRGFEKDHNGRCTDYDECLINNGGCSQRCINKYGSYECHCKDGFKLSSDGHTCVDIDECSEYSQTGICSPQVSVCENTIGSYRCRCRTGFRDPDGTGKHCTDVDECLEQTNLCEQKCLNTFGSYKCQCNRGYRPVGPHRCEDIDECHEGDFINDIAFSRFRHDDNDGHPKLCQGGCENSAGSYRCTCPNGYNLVHNHHCIDINECQEFGYCRGSNQSCVNIGGSFRCVDDRCPPGYHKDGVQCKISQRLNYAEICDDPTEVCSIDRIICYSYAYIAFRSRMIKQHEHIEHHQQQQITTITTKGDTKTDIKTNRYQSAVTVQRLQHQQQQQQRPSTVINGRGHEFFTFIVPVELPIIVDFKLRLVSVKSPRPGVRSANLNDFEMRRTADNEVRLAIMSSLEGPQDIELEIEAKMYKNGLQIGKNLAIITIFISEYEF